MEQSDVHFIKRAMDKTGEETSAMMIKINELKLVNERSDQELKKAKAIKQVQYYFAALLIQPICLFLKHVNS